MSLIGAVAHPDSEYDVERQIADSGIDIDGHRVGSMGMEYQMFWVFGRWLHETVFMQVRRQLMTGMRPGKRKKERKKTLVCVRERMIWREPARMLNMVNA